jgi:hypothetical protein
MEIPYFAIFIVVIVGLIALRAVLRERFHRNWKTVFETNARGDGTVLLLRRRLSESDVRARLVYKGPPNSPHIGIAGDQYVAVQVRVEDLGHARPIVSQILNEEYRGRL